MTGTADDYIKSVMRDFPGGRVPGYTREFVLPGGAWYTLAVKQKFAPDSQARTHWLGQNLETHDSNVTAETNRLRDLARWGG